MEGKINLELTRSEAILLFHSILNLERHDVLDTKLSEAGKYVFAYLATMLEKDLTPEVGSSTDALQAAEASIQAGLVSVSALKCHENLLSQLDRTQD